MKLEPVITEKTIAAAKEGKYTFRVNKSLNKFGIKDLIEQTFDVHVVNVRTITESGEKKRTIAGRKRIIKPGKKAVVTLKDKETLDLFEVKK